VTPVLGPRTAADADGAAIKVPRTIRRAERATMERRSVAPARLDVLAAASTA
jgi:hypothetical protein